MLLRGCVEVGPGTVYRAIEQAQRAHFDPPQLDETRAVSRWARHEPRYEKISKRAV